MYGVVHKGMFAWIRTYPDGEEKLHAIAELVGEAHLDDFFRFYNDSTTEALLSAVVQVMHLGLDECTYQAGLQFMGGLGETGFQSTLFALGDNLFSVLENIDSLHESFRPSFPEMKAPSLKPERTGENSMDVHYRSESDNLAPFVMGAIKSCAKTLFDLDIDMVHRTKKGQSGKHDVFNIYAEARAFPATQQDYQFESKMTTMQINPFLSNKLFPFHICFDRNLKIVSVGSSLTRHIIGKDVIGSKFSTFFKLARPLNVELDFDELLHHIGESVLIIIPKKVLKRSKISTVLSANFENVFESGVLSSRVMSRTSSALSAGSMQDDIGRSAKLARSEANLKLHGEIIHVPESDTILFAGCPILRSLEEMDATSMHLWEIPLHSHGKDVLFSSMLQAASAQNTNKIDAKLAELDKTMEEVNLKSQQVDNLLHSILPPRVARSLAEGYIPPAEQYEEVSLLYSDIAGFTNISSNLPPIEVVNMLHTLFVKFDELAERHGCYKVETIGDAYVVSAGCPEECDDHALRLANFAIDMLHTVSTVKSPVDGEPLRMRVGLHSGPVMAGVVGRVRPRYCLFGDTVNFAASMESSGIPCCIQASYRFVECLPRNHPFQIVSRGHIHIKNKGPMKTFLILGDEELDFPPLLPTPSKIEDIGPQLLNMARIRADNSQDRIATIQTAKTRRLNRQFV
eukprot:m.9663 g.9663  ORF g.9663 m.9663 type:complete len:685 (-) comp3512_c0_seq1:180-2234(-)